MVLLPEKWLAYILALTHLEDRALLESNLSARMGFCRGQQGFCPASFVFYPTVPEENKSDKLWGEAP
jgi:hypothetical protein